jgi:hypothetical protein
MNEKKRREAHGGADPYADVVQLVRAQVIGDDDLHGELIAPYWEDWERMYGLFTSAEAFARSLATDLATREGMSTDEYLQQFALKWAEQPPEDS